MIILGYPKIRTKLNLNVLLIQNILKQRKNLKSWQIWRVDLFCLFVQNKETKHD